MQTPHGLGRFPAVDERDEQYPLESVMKTAEQLTPDDEKALERGWRYWWTGGWWGNQGATPQCVAYSWLHHLEDGPITKEPKSPGAGPAANPTRVYDMAQRRDEWPGERYDGTSIRGGAKAMVDLGLIKEYRWANSIETIIRTLLVEGPIVFGSYWYRDMFYPDQDGIISVSGDIVGGHAYLLNGVNTKTGIVRFKNSWGRGWGKKGFGYLYVNDLVKLLDRWGDACRPVR